MIRVDVFLLWAVVLLSLMPRLILGAHQFIHYDGYWHVFIATQDQWQMFISEWKGDAHPPLYYLLLRCVAKLGHSHLVYRSLSIIPGIGTVYVIGRTVEKLCNNRFVPLLTAAAYGFSMTMIDITCDVRGYALSLFFVLCAFYFLIDILVHSPHVNVTRPAISFGVFTSLAIGTEYYAVFFWIASMVVLVENSFRSKWLVRNRRQASIALALPACTCIWLYLVHLQYQPPAENNVIEFYFSPGTSVTDFVLSNLRTNVNYFLPVEIPSTFALIVLVVVALAALLYFILSGSGTPKQIAAAAPALVLVLLYVELIALSLLRRYPLGGYARQQSIVFPFLTLTVFLLLDRILQKVHLSSVRSTLLIATACAITVSFVYGWRKFPKVSEELFTPQYDRFRTELQPAAATYVDQFSLIAYYIHTHDFAWRFQKHFVSPERVDEYQIHSPDGQHTALLRNKYEWNFDLFIPKFYVTLASSMHNAQLQNANLFFVKQMPQPAVTAAPDGNVKLIQELADRAGLIAAPLIYKNTEAYIGFRVK